MTIPAIAREDLDAPGDVIARPHPNCYWVVTKRLLAGEHPGAFVPLEGIDRVDALIDTGVRTFIDLTDEDEGPAPYVDVLLERAEVWGVRVVHSRFTIPDLDVPSAAFMRRTLDAIYAAMAAGEPTYLHCWGGIGRTGTVVGCLLREQGFDAADALEVIARKWQSMEKRDRHPRSPETPEQIAFIERWPGA